ncbi:Uncharacterised protein [Vibrio cholerae]|uniref:Uncharacterized protein n=1 Tax=Vibrio cholerae TaxID=666 RepID=A0A655XBL4_VIBCL|nr:Uncharacterised protein [Vibrio cholerae]
MLWLAVVRISMLGIRSIEQAKDSRQSKILSPVHPPITKLNG